jgi:hypothetical protein
LSFAAKEISPYDGNPADLYHFAVDDDPIEGTGAEDWYYTSGDILISFGGQSYVPAPLTRGRFDGGELELNVAYDFPVVVQLANQRHIDLTITRVHRDDLNGRVVFKGRVMRVRLTGKEATLVCWPLLKLAERPMPQYIFQTGCNWQIYSEACGVNPGGLDAEGYTIKAIITVDSIGATGKIISSNLNIPSAGGPPDTTGATYDEYYTAGYAQWTDGDLVVHRRFITESDTRGGAASYIKVLTPFPAGMVATEQLAVVAGCLRTASVCATKFDNFANFGGFPSIPKRNPFENQ